MPDSSGPEAFGHVDHGSLQSISGWAFDPLSPDDPVELEILDRDRLICRAHAGTYRQDLEQSGYGDGRHGFAVELPADAFLGPVVDLRVRVRVTGQELAGCPLILPNRRVLLMPETLAEIEGAVAAAAAAARSSRELQPLALWLLRQLDTVWGRQSALESSARARTNRFFEMVGENTSLSSLLRQAAEAVVAQYKPLHLPEVPRPDVSVIVPAHNHFDYTYRCLASIIRHRPDASIEVLLTDDGSTDETVYAGFILSGGIRVLRTGANTGFVHAVNLAAAAARGRFLFLLNNDTEVEEHWLDELLGTFAEDGAVGVAGSKLLYPDGRLQEAGGIIWRQGTGMNWGRGDDPARPEYCYMRDADYVSGAALLIPRALFTQVGGLSDAYAPAYYEDTDLCFKVRAAGFRVVVQPLSRIVHHEGVTAGSDPDGDGAKRFQRINQRNFMAAWAEELQQFPLSGSDPRDAAERLVRRRALFIDDTVPTPDRDAGSNAALEHMRSLQRLGYQVSFVGADNMAKISPYTEALERVGIHCYYAPYYWSVEEIFRRETRPFDLFYVHRVANMTKYASMIRQRCPGSRIVFNVADLHHLRHEREAALRQSPVLERKAQALMAAELAAVAAADAVIVHSTHEQDVLAQAGVTTRVHVMPWTVRAEPGPAPFAARSGIALIGGYNHTPNVDAAEWLADTIMPLVAPQGIECLLVGSDMPDAMRALERPGVRVLGHVADLSTVLERVRLTVAPIRFGAGLKGKVLTSLAAGVPCVMTRCAAEGMGLPEAYDVAIADTADGLAERIIQVHADPALFAMLRDAGLAFVDQACAPSRIDALLAAACQRPWPAV